MARELKIMQIMLKTDLKPFNLNQMISDARANKYGSAAKKKKLMSDIYYQIKSQVKTPLLGKYHVHALWLVPDKGRDLDNLMLKALFDCMQNHGLLANDNLNHITRIEHDYIVVGKKDTGLIATFEEIE